MKTMQPLMASPLGKSQIAALLVSHSGQRCGVFQFGRRLFEVLKLAPNFSWDYAECGSFEELEALTKRLRPDVLILNHTIVTLRWAETPRMRSLGATVFNIFHESYQEAADNARPTFFDFVLCPDPTLIPRNPIALPVPRFIPDPSFSVESPEIFTVGSFGFATPRKGFDRLCRIVNSQFDAARVRINLPHHDRQDLVPKEQLDHIVGQCHAAITKPGIELHITHDFYDEDGLQRFLAGNTINVFVYEDTHGRGISSATDHALASGRPIAVSRSVMFRHLLELNPSICVDDVPLAAIVARGSEQLQSFRQAFAKENAAVGWAAAIREALERRKARQQVPDRRGYNKILDNRSRAAYSEAVGLLEKHAAPMLARKIPRANIQQAFALDTFLRFAKDLDCPRVLALGSYEDTCVAALKSLGYRIDEVDPNVSHSDAESFYLTDARLGSYDIVLCVSVLEHVADDHAFMRMTSDFLAPGGVGIFTVDFADNWTPGKHKPSVDHRLYTDASIHSLLRNALPACALIDAPSWKDGLEDFEYQGCEYGFAGLVFRKLSETHLRRAVAAPNHQAEPAWKHRLAEEGDRLNANWLRLTDQLRADGAPAELRIALKLARLLRKIRRAFVKDRPAAVTRPTIPSFHVVREKRDFTFTP